jgi:hypothetical protein
MTATTFETTTDDRGVEYALAFVSFRDLPAGWATCGACGISWNDDKPTVWTPVPSGRCPFEAEHDEDDDECEGHESTSGAIGTTVYCDGTCRG